MVFALSHNPLRILFTFATGLYLKQEIIKLKYQNPDSESCNMIEVNTIALIY